MAVVICTATNCEYRVHSQALDKSCGTSAPVFEVLLRHLLRTQTRDKLKPITMCHASTYQFHRPCLLVTTCLLFVRLRAIHTSTPPIYVYTPSPYSTANAAASELERRRPSRPLTCSNSGNLTPVSYPPTAAGGWWHKNCST